MRSFPAAEAQELVAELFRARVLMAGEAKPEPLEAPPADFPLQTLVMNLTNQCNLSCAYCYEFGEDKVATPEGKPKFMDTETAKASVDFLLEQSAGRKSIHITFFGGETLMNFPLLQEVVAYANRTRRGAGPAHRFQPDHQRHPVDARDHRVSLRQRDRSDGQHGRPARIARSSCASSPTAGAVTISSRRVCGR